MDDILPVRTDDAKEMARRLAREAYPPSCPEPYHRRVRLRFLLSSSLIAASLGCATTPATSTASIPAVAATATASASAAPSSAPAPPESGREIARFEGDVLWQTACDARRIVHWRGDGGSRGTFFEIPIAGGPPVKLASVEGTLLALSVHGDAAYALLADHRPDQLKGMQEPMPSRLVAVKHDEAIELAGNFVANTMTAMAVDDRRVAWLALRDGKADGGMTLFTRGHDKIAPVVKLDIEGLFTHLYLLDNYALAFSTMVGSSTIDLTRGTASFKMGMDYESVAVGDGKVYAVRRKSADERDLVQTIPALRVLADPAPRSDDVSPVLVLAGDYACTLEDEFTHASWAPGIWCSPRSGGAFRLVVPGRSDEIAALSGCGDALVWTTSKKRVQTIRALTARGPLPGAPPPG
jgi:hypothetical protein